MPTSFESAGTESAGTESAGTESVRSGPVDGVDAPAARRVRGAAGRRVARRAPRTSSRTTAVRPAGVRRPAASRAFDGRLAAAAVRVDDVRSGVACSGDVHGGDGWLPGRRGVRRTGARGRVTVSGAGAGGLRPVAVGTVRQLADRPATARPETLGSRRRAVGGGGGSRPAVRTSAPASVQLTRRGRVVVLLVAVGIALAVLTVVGPHSAATGEGGTPVRTHTVEVAPGDTLWGIASGVAAPGHVRDMVHQIEELNAMTGPSVSVGQQIAVPVG